MAANADLVDTRSGTVGQLVDQEKITQLPLNPPANKFTAEYGNAGGGIVNIVTRSGSNQVHESAFEFLRNHSLNHSKQEVERCFLEFRNPVFRYLRALGCEHSITEEITQETFLRLLRALQTEHRVNDERAWVFRVARNLYIDCRRERQRFLVACKDEGNLQDRMPNDAEPDPEQQMLQRERTRLIEEEVLRLPELQRECMHPRAQRLRCREIATTLDISMSAAVECIRSAVKKLGSVATQ